MSAQSDFTRQLKRKYPAIFMSSQTVECGPGWFVVIENLLEQIQQYLDTWPDKKGLQVSHIKQKFGELRINYTGGDDACAELIAQAAISAQAVCEQCGQPGRRQAAGGIAVLCDEHVPSVAGEEVLWLLECVVEGSLTVQAGAKTLADDGSLQSCGPLPVPYCGIWVALIEGWHIGIFVDCDRLDYIEWAVSPDQRLGKFAEWDARGEEPISLLQDNQLIELEKVVAALSSDNGQV